ncbi:hypothetical protein PVK06_015367 [Gossypium arboreum]|uniref:Uncharacterized protein n=1 Tax=Gossypium arboreum TaxID=29729 RepID=A0ABR0PXD5_GOSAR|nr:hypothetical protein PVK06_015367 [Gossypium arboreum]
MNACRSEIWREGALEVEEEEKKRVLECSAWGAWLSCRNQSKGLTHMDMLVLFLHNSYTIIIKQAKHSIASP